jgi:hypothetical protein
MEVSGQLHDLALYPQGKSPWYPLDRRLGGPQSRSERGEEEKNSQPLAGLEPPIMQSVVPSSYLRPMGEMSHVSGRFYLSMLRQYFYIGHDSVLQTFIFICTTHDHLPLSLNTAEGLKFK